MDRISPSDTIKLFGTEQPGDKPRKLTAGGLTALFDAGGLRRITWFGAEVLRGIAYLPRDKNWGTYAPAIEKLSVTQRRGGFSVTYDVSFADAEQSLHARARIEATASGLLTFSVTATPGADFTTNRTGFVVLHPLQGVVGKPVDVTHVDGSRERRTFPKLISPGQPILEIRSLAHRVLPGVTATLRMEGNKFEMEDHRNWMDASYKTYVCSLLDPWPYTLPKDQSFTQSITLTITGQPARPAAKRADATIAVTLGTARGRLPAIGTAVSMADAPSALAHADLIAAARPACLVCQIDGRLSGQAEAAAIYQDLKSRTGIPITLEIILPAEAPASTETAEIARALKSGGLAPDTVIITQAHDLKSFQPGTPRPWGPSYQEMAAAARAAFPGIRIGGGMLSFFTELNRKPPPGGLFDFITHSTCPIVHAADDLSVMETLEALPWIVKSTRAMIGSAPYHLGPSSLACRDNPYGATVFANPDNRRICLSDMDPRQRGLFAAAWMLGLASAGAKGGLNAIALGSATGPRGVIHARADYPQPGFDRTNAEVFPAYHILAGLAPNGGSRLIATETSAPATIVTLAHQTPSGSVLWIANLTDAPQRVKVAGFTGTPRLHAIDTATFAATTLRGFLSSAGEKLTGPVKLDLGPYAVIRVSPAP